MADVTVIGRASFVRGRISGSTDLEIHGHVEGDVAVSGEVLVEAQGLVGANLSGRRLVVRGAVKGDLVAEEAILLEDGARVVGDVRAPRVAITPGALVRGYVQTSAEGSARPARASARGSNANHHANNHASSNASANNSARNHAKPVPSAPRSSQSLANADRSRPSAPSSAGSVPGRRNNEERPSRGSLLAGGSGSYDGPRRGPPPPVVPSLKKGAKGIHKKAHGASKR
jgi:cytoskeletal protein CcmA (bactofilin family)